MATIFCSKSGSDANNGSTYALSKLTIGASITAAGSGTVIIGSGLYNEKITTTSALLLYFDGVVVLDGTGITTNSAINIGNSTATLAPYTSGGVLIVQNHNATNLVAVQGAGAGQVFQNVIFLSSANSVGISMAFGYAANIFLYNCLFSGFTTAIYAASGVTATPITCYNCTFYNGTTAILLSPAGGSPAMTLANNIFSNFTTAWSFTAAAVITTINLNQYYNITNWVKGASTYTTLPQVQAAGYDSLSAVSDPQFTDAANNIFYLKAQSSVSPTVGMYPYGLTRGAANDVGGLWHIIPGAGYDNSGWYNPDGNITKNGTTGYFELTGGSSGVVWSPVMNLGMVQSISQLNIESIQTFPTNMIDSTLADVRPNYQTSEIRASNSSFNQNDGTIAWVTVKNNLPFTSITGQYVQVRFTLTSADVQG